MNASFYLWIILGAVVIILAVFVLDALVPPFPADAGNVSYLACGCGCCVTEPIRQCLYHSRNNDMAKIIEHDKATAQSPQCAYTGCSRGVEYTYCD